MDFEIRLLREEDGEAVLAIENRSFEFPWTEEDFSENLNWQNCLCIVADNHAHGVLGYAIYNVFRDQVELLSIAVHPEYVRKGIGTALVDIMRKKLLISCMVRERNLTAQLFFRSAGFMAVEVLPGYFPELDDEDAYIFECKYLPTLEEALG